jgi:hypothetical protein
MKQTRYIQNNYNTNIAINRKTYEEYFGPNINSYCPNKTYFQEKPTSSNFSLNKGLEKILH